MKRLAAVLFFLCLLMLPAQALEPSQVVVVYNADSELSTKSAQRYARLRNIPELNLVALRGLRGGHISRAEFETKIRHPLLFAGHKRGWRWPSGYTRGSTKRIAAMVLMPDMPLGIYGKKRPKDAPKLGPLQQDRAAVDSELMTLGGDVPIEGMLANPCFGKDFSLDDTVVTVMAVCRIDGPDEASINRMIDDPSRVERHGLRGWTVVDQGGKYKEGDEWMASIARRAKADGQPVFHETSRKTLAEAFPLMMDTAVYFGWYAHPANGPFNPKTPGGFRFAPGAVAVHLHSNSATSVKKTDVWVAALLSRGAAVTAGNVFEPYFDPSLNFSVFFDRLMKGCCVAEAALMASPVLSWHCIVLGDPLYRPFAAPGRHAADDVYAEWRHIRLDARDDLSTLRRTVSSRLSSSRGAALAEMFAWHCAELGEWGDAIEFFSAACGRYAELRDRTRALIMATTAMSADGQKERALQQLRRWIDAGLQSPYRPALIRSYEAISGEKWPAEDKNEG